MRKYKFLIVKTTDILVDGTPIFRYSVFNEKGQMVDAGEMSVNSFQDVKEILNDKWNTERTYIY